MSIDKSVRKRIDNCDSVLDGESDNMIQGTTLRESNLSGKNTAATISDPAGFGFCADDLKGDPKIKPTEEGK